MKRVIIKTRDITVNIKATCLKEENGMVYVYYNDDLVGIVDCGELSMIYLSEKKEV